MIIAAKTAIDRKQIEDRKNRGANYLELHTIPEYFDGSREDVDFAKEYKNLLKEYDMQCICVHSPIKNSYKQGCGVGYYGKVADEKYLNNMFLLKESLVFAEKVLTGDRRLCVVHVPESFTFANIESMEKEKEYFMKDVLELSRFAKENAPHVVITIENTIKAIDKKRGLSHKAVYGYKEEFVRWVEELNLENIGVMLDVCHALATSNYRRSLGRKDFLELEDYFRAYKKKLWHIHLSNSYNFGFEEDHGESYKENERDIAILKKIDSLISEIDYKGNITIETVDKSVYAYERYTETVNVIKNHGIFKGGIF